MNVTLRIICCSTGFCNFRVEFYQVSGVPASDIRKLSFYTFTFDTLVFSLNFNVGEYVALFHMLFVKFIFEQFLIHGITIFIMIVTNYTS